MSAPDTIAAALDEAVPVAPVNTFYDAGRMGYLWPAPDGSWLPQNEGQIKRHLLAAGYERQARKGEPVSSLDRAIIQLQLHHKVDYAAPLAGYRAGPYTMQGRKILVTSSPALVDPVPGEWPTVRHVLESMLADPDHDQLGLMDAWLSVSLRALYAGKPRTGPVLCLCGPKDCGKSLWQAFLTVLLGGRSAKPYQYAMGSTDFNADLFYAEHLMVEDENPSTDMRARRMLGAHFKAYAANTAHKCHAKGRDGLTLEPFWRCTVSVNDEPEHLLTLPPLDESLLDKVILLRCRPPAEPFNDGTAEGRDAFMKALTAEAPAYVHHLLAWRIPEHLTHPRFGVTAFQHPELVEALLELSSERQLLSLVDVARLIPAIGPWEGTAEDLERALREDDTTRREAERLFTWRAAAGVFLGRLAQTDRARVRKLERRHGEARRWAIHPPAPWKEDALAYH